MDNKLQITQVAPKQAVSPPPVSKAVRRQEIQAKMERMWQQDPEQFSPDRDCVERHRVARTFELLKQHVNANGLCAADLGCGGGTLTRLVRDAGATVDAVDVAYNALAQLKSHDMHRINAIQDCLPMTKLADNAYDIILCTEVLGFLKSSEYRLAFSELGRIVKTEGLVVCSTRLDLNSDNALERFATLAETEFEIDSWILSYDLLWIRLCHFFEAPRLYATASQNPELRKSELDKRRPIGKFWFRLNSSPILGFFWKMISLISNPLAYLCRQSSSLMNILGRLTSFIWSESGISHALFIGKRRKMVFPLPKDEQPREMKHKRQVWE